MFFIKRNINIFPKIFYAVYPSIYMTYESRCLFTHCKQVLASGLSQQLSVGSHYYKRLDGLLRQQKPLQNALGGFSHSVVHNHSKEEFVIQLDLFYAKYNGSNFLPILHNYVGI